MKFRQKSTGREVDVPASNPRLADYYRGEGWTEVAPPASASKAEWVEYAEEHGDPDAAEKTKAELQAEHGDS